jgi:preprotein translocase subunit YajC
MLLISEAIAQTNEAGVPPEPSAASNFIPLVLIFMIFYFFIIRPQQKKLKDHNQMVDSIKKGDEIITGGGMLGKVVKVEDNVLHLEVAPDMVVKVLRSTVSNNNSTEKAAEKAEKKASEKDNKKNSVKKKNA